MKNKPTHNTHHALATLAHMTIEALGIPTVRLVVRPRRGDTNTGLYFATCSSTPVATVVIMQRRNLDDMRHTLIHELGHHLAEVRGCQWHDGCYPGHGDYDGFRQCVAEVERIIAAITA